MFPHRDRILYCCYILLYPHESLTPWCNVTYPIPVFQRHVPAWLQSTRIYRWPQDTQDLVLRLLREERYIAPSLGKEMTLSIRPL